MKKIFLFIMLCLLVVGVSNGMCETDGPVFFVSPMFGGHIFDGNQDLDNKPTYGLGIGAEWDRQYGVEAMFNWTDSYCDPRGADVNVGGYRLDGFYNFMIDEKLIPYAAAGFGGNHFDQSGADRDHLIFDFGGGVKYFINDSFAIRGDVRNVIGFNHSYDNLLYTVGLSWFFKAPECLKSVGKKPVALEKIKEPVVRDQDRDGVFDVADQCPNTPSGVEVDANGCPFDTDLDGVPDYLDKCPGTAMRGAVNSDGCPADTDKDGVNDDIDKCPGTPIGVHVNKNGCWEIESLTFETNKSVIRPPVYYPILDKIVRIMENSPELKIEIQGYTDDRGGVMYNKKLSEKRAEAVKAYLVSKGIEAGRISTVGYGACNPVASNDTAEGRAKNRRIEINVQAGY